MKKDISAFAATNDFLVDERNTSSILNDTDKILAQAGCLFAVAPSSPHLKMIFESALRKGISIKLLEASVIHAAGYTGFANAAMANNLLEEVITEAGRETEKSPAPDFSHQTDERVSLGYRLYGRFDASRAAKQKQIYEVVSDFYYPRAMEFAGFVLKDESISLRERQVLTIAMLSCLGIAPQLQFHTTVALKNGVSRDEIAAILLFVQVYGGLPKANTAALIIGEVFGQAK